MANVANSTLTTNFNVTPYYDDYEPEKQYYRNLFRPGQAVQARELTQSQTMLQKQIDRFGKHVFREGSIVLPGQFSIEKDIDYVKIQDQDSSNNDVTIADYKDAVITGSTNGIKAYVIETIDGTEDDANTKTLFVRYMAAAAANAQIKTFVEDEPLTANAGNLQVLSTSATGNGSRFLITEGVMFAKEHFIYFPTSSVVLSTYESTPTVRVGFDITESLVKYTADSSLLDPALESSNYTAPGADRLKLDPTLRVLDIDDTTGAPDFVELFTIRDGVIQEIYERSQYNILQDEIAKRTYDESGDYYVNGLDVRLREHLDSNTNDGYLTTGQGGNTSLLAIGVEPGVAYIKGYEVGKLVTTYVTTTKSEDYGNVNAQFATATQGNYIKANNFVGTLTHDRANTILLTDTADRRITENKWSTAAISGSVIGVAKLSSIVYDSGSLGTDTGNVKMYLIDVQMNGTSSFADVRSIFHNNGSVADLGADIILNANGNAQLYETGLKPLIYSVGSKGVKTIRDSSGTADMSYQFYRTEDITVQTDGTVTATVTTSGDGETLPYGIVTLSAAQRQDLILSINADVTHQNLGGSVVNTGNQLTGTGTSFTNWNPGDKIEFQSASGPTGTYVINNIASDTIMTVKGVDGFAGCGHASVTSNGIAKVYKTGDIIDMASKGQDAGTTRSAAETGTDTLVINLQETYDSTFSSSLTYKVSRAAGVERTKTLANNRVVLIDCSSHFTGANGPFSLGMSDIYQVRQIRVDTSAHTDLTSGRNVTDRFTINKGQKDAIYDHGTVTPTGITLTTSDHLIIEFDAFIPSYSTGYGYFSVDSYPVDDTSSEADKIKTENIPLFISPTTRQTYDLKDSLDFRPTKSATAVSTITIGSATTNPANTNAVFYETNGMRLPVPDTQLTYDYSYYKARRDLVTMDRDGNIIVIRGNPSTNPVTPAVPENTMLLATLYIAPYPSTAPNYAQKINRKDLASIIRKQGNKRFTMRDIGTLRDRIVNLEYYASLTALEKNAVDMLIQDENGLNRFKNGIFVDSFRDHKLGDSSDPAYKIVVDPQEKSIRPCYTMDSIYYNVDSTSGTTQTGDLITLPYTEVTLLDQTRVTGTRNIEVSSYRFVGTITMTPSNDVWVDTEYAEDNALTIGPDGNNIPQTLNTEWDAWKKKVVGYNLYNKATGELLGTFDATEKDLAYNNAYWLARDREFNRNTLGLRGRKFSSVVETVYESTRTGSETFTGISETTENLGNKVIDVSLIPYMRPQSIKLKGRGLKANTQFYTFFDGEDMSLYTTPANTATAFANYPLNTAFGGTEGGDVISDKDGYVYAILRLPETKRFRVGTKEVVLTDVTSNNDDDASSAAKGHFVSHGLVQTKQDTILTTRQVIQIQKDVDESKSSTTQYTQKLRPSCSAYSFVPKAPEGEEGVFLTSVDIYISAKDSNLGIWCEIREMNDAGGITRNQVPLSEKWLTSAEVTADATTPTATNILFDSPVFLYNNVQYAFVIHTEGLNPNYYLWISRLGEEDVNTGTVVTARPLTGTFFTTNNNRNWDIVPDVDLLVTFNRAAFTKDTTGTVTLGNKPIDKLRLDTVSAIPTTRGEHWRGRDVVTLSSLSHPGWVNVGDVLFGNTSLANLKVESVSGSDFTMNSSGFILNETVTMNDSDISAANGQNSAIASAIVTAGGTFSKFLGDANNKTIELVSSTGTFVVGDVLTGITSGVTANVVSQENWRFSVVDFEPGYLTFAKTTIDFKMKATSNSTQTLDSAFQVINDNDNYYYGAEKVVLSRTNEIANTSGNPSNQVQISMLSSSEYVSPVVDIARTHSILIDNQTNSNTLNENTASSGALTNKYISLPVTLADGQDAEDILVIVTAYRPTNTDIPIWLRILHNEDSDDLDDRDWIALEKVDNSIYSSDTDLNDFREFSYIVPSANLSGTNAEVQYQNKANTTFTGYKHFQVKVGLSANSSAIVPRVADLRAVALQK
jgi:hypothetical protein